MGDGRGRGRLDGRSRKISRALAVSDADLVVRGGTVVTSTEMFASDIAIRDGQVTAVGPSLELSADEEIDAAGLHVFPGGIDSHVHFSDPGRPDWEPIACGSAAAPPRGSPHLPAIRPQQPHCVT